MTNCAILKIFYAPLLIYVYVSLSMVRNTQYIPLPFSPGKKSAIFCYHSPGYKYKIPTLAPPLVVTGCPRRAPQLLLTGVEVSNQSPDQQPAPQGQVRGQLLQEAEDDQAKHQLGP